MGGDAPQALSRGPSWGVTLLHQVREVDVASEAIAVTVARSLLLSRCLRGHNTWWVLEREGKGHRVMSPLTQHRRSGLQIDPLECREITFKFLFYLRK